MKSQKIAGLIIGCLLVLHQICFAAHSRVDLYEDAYKLNPDLTYTETISIQKTLITQQGIESGQRAEQTFFPDTQMLKLVDAYVIQPNGQKVPVTKDNVFTRPSQAAEDAPGFTNSYTTTVVFPKLEEKSRTYVRWTLTQLKPPVLGFSVVDAPSFDEEVKQEKIIISAPASLPLSSKQRGGFMISRKNSGGRQIITAEIKNQPERQSEDHMTSEIDAGPVFAASTLSSWEELGQLYWQQSKRKIIVSPEIINLASKVAGHKKGEEAARALYNWVAQNIQYVAVYLNEAEGYVPHSSAEVLKNGYGDCKDKVVLLQALLRARGIESCPVLIDWDEMFEKLPVPSPEQFNHVIIYLPDFRIFANPTDRFASFGTLDPTLCDKFAIIAKEKSHTTYTPKALAKENRYELYSKISISGNGQVEGDCAMKFAGSTSIDARNLFGLDETPEQIAKAILAQTPEGGMGRYSAKNPENLDNPLEISGKWKSPYAINLGSQAYFSVPYGLDLKNPHRLRDLISQGKRKYPLAVGAQQLAWNFEIFYPRQYHTSRLPAAFEFKNSSGLYASNYRNESNKLIITRRLILEKNIYSAQEYIDLEKLLYKAINDAREVICLSM